ncbi:MAG TPA: DUF389 domain-containing protein [Ilumatobacteraceae bacterium]|nr:DUF389 domain-containing protein [Ilumatobacteraceae bacterium]
MPGDIAPDATTGRLTAAGSVIAWLRETWRREPSADEHAAIDELIPQGGPEFYEYTVRFSFLILLSASIAAFGLLADSSAVVIGAMLVAPLMTPITAVAGAIVTARNPRLWRAFAVIAWGIVLAVAVGWFVSLIAGGTANDPRELPREVQARTFPGLLDLGIAVAAGAAAGYILPRKSTIGALPGVGIAVALVPPLATVGITFQYGFPSEAWNAFLLFLTNLAAIVFAASIALVLTGFRPSQYSGRRALRTRLAITLVVVAVIAIPLTVHTLATFADVRLRRAVTASVESWDSDVRIVDLQSEVTDGRAVVDLLLSGSGDPRPVWALAEEIRRRFDGPVDLRLLYQRDELFTVSAR